jgi:hypothetical protein
MENKFISQSPGIGDIIVLKSYINQFFNNSKDKIYIDYNKDHIRTWRDNVDEYYPFLIKLANFILPNDYIIVEEGLEGGKQIDTATIVDYYKRLSSDRFKVIDMYHKNIEKDSGKIILHTKVRGLYNHDYNRIKDGFYKILNESKNQIIVLGEKEIEYGREYAIHTNRIIYSIYSDIINNIDSNKIIDLTVPRLGITTPDFDKLADDIKLMSNYKNIVFGIGGTLLLALYACSPENIIGCVPPGDICSPFLNTNNNLKYPSSFLNELSNFLNL